MESAEVKRSQQEMLRPSQSHFPGGGEGTYETRDP